MISPGPFDLRASGAPLRTPRRAALRPKGS